jgi:hypothetical protein
MGVQNIDVDKLNAFTKAYIEAALFSSSVEQAGVDLGVASHTDSSFLDANFDAGDIAPESLKAIVIECRDFQEQNKELLAAAAEDDAQHGHDFWLTRNRHGAGFWDRGYPDGLGGKLTEAAHAFGECDLYIGDDGKVHVSNAHEYQEQELDEELTKGVSR